jgi:hypothetical protein
MDSLLFEIRGHAQRGHWCGVLALAESLPSQTLPATADGLAAYLRDLKETLILARAERARAVESLARLNAAARFHRSRAGIPSRRQEFGEAAGS